MASKVTANDTRLPQEKSKKQSKRKANDQEDQGKVQETVHWRPRGRPMQKKKKRKNIMNLHQTGEIVCPECQGPLHNEDQQEMTLRQ